MTRFTGVMVLSTAICCASGNVTFLDAQGVDKPDQTFVMKASESGMAEVELGKLGAAQATRADVKKFAEKMVADHQKANQELMAFSRDKGYKVATGLMKEHQEAAVRVGKLQGVNFDRDFMAQMVKDHEDAVELFSTQAQSGHDAELKAWAAKTLPALREHLQMAKSIAATTR